MIRRTGSQAQLKLGVWVTLSLPGPSFSTFQYDLEVDTMGIAPVGRGMSVRVKPQCQEARLEMAGFFFPGINWA